MAIEAAWTSHLKVFIKSNFSHPLWWKEITNCPSFCCTSRGCQKKKTCIPWSFAPWFLKADSIMAKDLPILPQLSSPWAFRRCLRFRSSFEIEVVIIDDSWYSVDSPALGQIISVFESKNEAKKSLLAVQKRSKNIKWSSFFFLSMLNLVVKSIHQLQSQHPPSHFFQPTISEIPG